MKNVLWKCGQKRVKSIGMNYVSGMKNIRYVELIFVAIKLSDFNVLYGVKSKTD